MKLPISDKMIVKRRFSLPTVILPQKGSFGNKKLEKLESAHLSENGRKMTIFVSYLRIKQHTFSYVKV